jgi:hypothetical protein
VTRSLYNSRAKNNTQPQAQMSLRNRFRTRLRDRVADDRLALAHHFLGRGSLRVRCEAAGHDHALHAAADALSPDWSQRGWAGLVEGEIDVEGRLHDVLRIGIALPSGSANPHRGASRLGWRPAPSPRRRRGSGAILSPLARPQHGPFLRLFRICAHITRRLLRWAPPRSGAGKAIKAPACSVIGSGGCICR